MSKKTPPVDDYGATIQRLAGLAHQMPRPAVVADAMVMAARDGDETAKLLCYAAIRLRVAAADYLVRHQRPEKRGRARGPRP